MWLRFFLTLWMTFKDKNIQKMFSVSPGQTCTHSIVLHNQRWHCCWCCAPWIQMSLNGLPLRCTHWIQVYFVLYVRPSLTGCFRDTFTFLTVQRLKDIAHFQRNQKTHWVGKKDLGEEVKLQAKLNSKLSKKRWKDSPHPSTSHLQYPTIVTLHSCPHFLVPRPVFLKMFLETSWIQIP